MPNFISVIKYCQKNKIPRQVVYRHIRERKLKEGEEFKKVKLELERWLIREDIKINYKPRYEKNY
jgi:hypothetical protein